MPEEKQIFSQNKKYFFQQKVFFEKNVFRIFLVKFFMQVLGLDLSRSLQSLCNKNKKIDENVSRRALSLQHTVLSLRKALRPVMLPHS